MNCFNSVHSTKTVLQLNTSKCDSDLSIEAQTNVKIMQSLFQERMPSFNFCHDQYKYAYQAHQVIFKCSYSF